MCSKWYLMFDNLNIMVADEVEGQKLRKKDCFYYITCKLYVLRFFSKVQTELRSKIKAVHVWHSKKKNYTLKINKTSTNVPLFLKLFIIIKKYHNCILFKIVQNVLDDHTIWCRMR